MRPLSAALLLLVAQLAPACGGLDEPVADATGAAGGSGGALGDAAAGSGGIAGSTGLDAAMDGSAGLDAAMGGSAGQGGGGTGGVAASGNFDCPLLGVAGAAGSSSADAASDGSSADAGPSSDAGATLRLRVVAANISSGNFQAYELPGIRIFQGLAPDVVLIQEFKYQSGTLRDLVDAAFGSQFCFFRETQVGGIPNGVVSRYPIIAYGEWQDVNVPDRDFAWTRINVPGPVNLWAVSVHLKTASAATRTTQAEALVGYIQAQVPVGDYLVVGGDLNTANTTEAAVGKLSTVVITGGTQPVDQMNNGNTNANRNNPYDWVLPNPSFASREIPVQLGASTYPFGLVFDTRVFTPLSEAAPAQIGDSGVSGMQHMAVVKDFALPTAP